MDQIIDIAGPLLLMALVAFVAVWAIAKAAKAWHLGPLESMAADIAA